MLFFDWDNQKILTKTTFKSVDVTYWRRNVWERLVSSLMES